MLYFSSSQNEENEYTPGLRVFRKRRSRTARLLLSRKTAVYCIQIKAGRRYETALLGSRRRSLLAASPWTEGVTRSGDGEAILSFWKGTLAAAALSAFIIIRHYSLAICSDLGKWF